LGLETQNKYARPTLVVVANQKNFTHRVKNLKHQTPKKTVKTSPGSHKGGGLGPTPPSNRQKIVWGVGVTQEKIKVKKTKREWGGGGDQHTKLKKPQIIWKITRAKKYED